MDRATPEMQETQDTDRAAAQAAWRRAAAKELAAPGAPPDEAAVDALTTPGADGATARPIFGDRSEAAAARGAPGAFPFVRGARPAGTAWVVASRHEELDLDRLARAVRDDVARGVEGIVLGVDRAGRLGLDAGADLAREAIGDGGAALVTASDLDRVLDGVDLARTLIWIDAGANATPHAVAALAALDRSGVDPSQARIFAGLDVAGALARDGALPRAVSALAAEAAELCEAWRTRGLGGRPLAIAASLVHEAGGRADLEIGFALAALAELLRALESRGVAPARVASAVAIEIAVGADVFAAIAKTRALRLAWSKLLVASGIAPADVPAPFVAARTSGRALAALDPWTNAVRGTTEAFAAAAAGVDLLVVRPWDEPLGAPDRGAQRLARNTQLILRDEARLADVADPAGGSGFVEAWTDELARAGWSELSRIEAEGGLLASLESGAFAARVREAATRGARDLARRKVVRIGVNDFAHPGEVAPTRRTPRDPDAVAAAVARARAVGRTSPTVPDAARLEVAGALVGRGLTLASVSQVLAVFAPEAPPSCEALAPRRDAARFEALRTRIAAIPRGAEPPRATLVLLGAPATARPRAGFSQRLLESGGFVVTTGLGAASEAEVAAAAASALESGAEVVCLCGTDDAYLALAEPMAIALGEGHARGRPPIVVQAGKPAEGRETSLREHGVSGWFFAGGDATEFLEELAARLELRAGTGDAR